MKSLSRRQFIKRAAGTTAAAAIGFPTIIPSSALGKAGTVAPSNRITVATVGWGMQGPPNTDNFLNEKDCRVIAVCDIDEGPKQQAKNTIDEFYGNKDCKAYHDYKELFARKDLDAVMLAVPDHWHGVMSVAALKAGKDVYGEKPLAHSYEEQQAIVSAVKRYGRVWQMGSWQRSQRHFRIACEAVSSGAIGNVHTIEVGLPKDHDDFSGMAKQTKFTEPPKTFDYETWLGPAPYAPYCPARTHMNWRWIMDYGGGQLLDWIGHHLDIAHWGMGMDYMGPTEVEAEVNKWTYVDSGIYNSPLRYFVHTKYPNGVKIKLASNNYLKQGTKWIGDEGWIHVDRGGFEASDPKIFKKTKLNESALFNSPGHMRDFLDCIKTRGTTLCPAEVGHRSAAPGHLAYISMNLGRKIHFDPVKEEILNDPQAAKLMKAPAMRGNYSL